ncbi:hypothetical protein BDC45DRAFT_597881 [Circinella umbellata]|nr:hypothetical protein BDC45DRAFT_597881 [Circinella umbellata]
MLHIERIGVNQNKYAELYPHFGFRNPQLITLGFLQSPSLVVRIPKIPKRIHNFLTCGFLIVCAVNPNNKLPPHRLLKNNLLRSMFLKEIVMSAVSSLLNDVFVWWKNIEKKGKLGIGVMLYCGGSRSNVIGGWNLYVSENRSEELAAAKANGESPIQESIGERIKRYSNTYDAEACMIYTQKAERHNLDTGLKGYMAPHDMTEKACELRLAYIKQACKRVSADLQSVKDITGIKVILCFGFPSIPKDAKYLDFYQNKVIASELGHAFWAHYDVLQEGPKFSEL